MSRQSDLMYNSPLHWQTHNQSQSDPEKLLNAHCWPSQKMGIHWKMDQAHGLMACQYKFPSIRGLEHFPVLCVGHPYHQKSIIALILPCFRSRHGKRGAP